jgi:hypothetical protein
MMRLVRHCGSDAKMNENTPARRRTSRPGLRRAQRSRRVSRDTGSAGSDERPEEVSEMVV